MPKRPRRAPRETLNLRSRSAFTDSAANIVQELNVAMTWLEYPGRKNGTVHTEGLDFSALGGVK